MKSFVAVLFLALCVSHASADFSSWVNDLKSSVYKAFTGADLFPANATLAPALPSGNYTFFANSKGRVLTVQNVTNVSQIITGRENKGHLSQKLVLTKTTDAYYYTISDSTTGFYLTANQNGTFWNVILAPGTGGYEQQWYVARLANSSNFTIQSRSSGLYLTLNNSHFVPHLTQGNGKYEQKWYALNLNESKVDQLSNYARVAFISQANGKAIDVAKSSRREKAPVVHSDFHNTANQKFYISKVDSEYYTIVAEHSGLALTVVDMDNALGQGIVQLPLCGDAYQQWKLIVRPNGAYTIENRLTGLELAVRTRVGGRVVLWSHSHRASHNFYVLHI